MRPFPSRSALALAPVALASLACSGAFLTPEIADDPDAPEAAPEADSPEAEPTAEPEGEPDSSEIGTGDHAGELYGELSVWENSGGQCVWRVRDAHTGEVGQELAKVPGKCPDRQVLSWSADGERVLVTFPESVWQITLDGATRAIPRLPVSASLDGAGYSEDGKIVVVAQPEAELKQDDEAERAWIEWSGQEYEVDYDEVQNAVEAELCVGWTLNRGKWEQGEAVVGYSGEGASWPWCTGSDHGIATDIVRQDEMGTVPMSTSLEPEDLPEDMQAEGSQWGAIALGGPHQLALQVEWLEGEQYGGPVRLWVDDQWSKLDEMNDTGWVFFEADSETLVVCRDKYPDAVGGVYDLKTGRLKWKSDGCPTFWERGSRG